jgi:hypothetical protein
MIAWVIKSAAPAAPLPVLHGEGSGVRLFGSEAGPERLRKRGPPHPLPPPRKDGEGTA